MKSVFGLIAISTLLLFSGCKPGPATITGSVSFLNPEGQYRDFPPTGHSGNLSDDVLYLRLLDNNGAGSTIWESDAIPAGVALSPFDREPTSEEGAYIASFVITLDDAQLSGLSMPLMLEAFLYDAPVSGTFPVLNPGSDAGRYSYYSSSWEQYGWFERISLRAGEVKTGRLSIIMPF
jgi:hypothetical protein